MAEKQSAASVDDYMRQLAPDVARALGDLRMAIRTAAPGAEEVMRMGAVTYLHRGNLVSFAAAARHCSFYVMSAAPIASRRHALSPLPATLVQAIVLERMQENEAR